MRIRIFLETPEGKIIWFNATSFITVESLKKLCDTDTKGWRIVAWFDENNIRKLDMRLDQRELAMILAALQIVWADHPGLIKADSQIEDIATNCGDFELLTKAEIDHLCERLNFGDRDAPINKLIANLDWALLFQRKQELLRKIWDDPAHKSKEEHPLMGIVHFLDELLDAAAEEELWKYPSDRKKRGENTK